MATPGGTPGFEAMFAPLLLGVIFNTILFGVFIVMVHSYFRLYKIDSTWIRLLIYYLILMETINTVCSVGIIYEPLIKLHDSPLVQVNSPKMLAADPIVTTLISTPVQLFMAWRIRLMTKSNWLTATVVLLAITSFIGGVVSSILVALDGRFAHFGAIEAPLALWLTSTAFADLFITAFLVNFLWVNKTGFKTQTDSVTDRIIFLTVQTGTLTSFAAIADVTLFLILPRTTFMFIWDFSLARLYSICLIATLNARHEWNMLLSAPSSLPTSTNNSERKGSAGSDAIIKIRRATEIQGLQLYIPSQFEMASQVNHTPRKRTPTTRSPLALLRATTADVVHLDLPRQNIDETRVAIPTGSQTAQWDHRTFKGRERVKESEIAWRTAEWARRTGR